MSYIYGEYIIVCQILKINAMRKKNFIWMSVAFIAGSIVGISLLGLFAFSGPASPQKGDPVIAKISQTDARTCFLNYYNAATVYGSKLKGFSINKAEYTAMSNILAAAPTLTGFRIYLGADASGNSLAIIVGIDTSGADIASNAYSATVPAKNVGPCPPTCDFNSPIGH
jgi:hypothetical protein